MSYINHDHLFKGGILIYFGILFKFFILAGSLASGKLYPCLPAQSLLMTYNLVTRPLWLTCTRGTDTSRSASRASPPSSRCSGTTSCWSSSAPPTATWPATWGATTRRPSTSASPCSPSSSSGAPVSSSSPSLCEYLLLLLLPQSDSSARHLALSTFYPTRILV